MVEWGRVGEEGKGESILCNDQLNPGSRVAGLIEACKGPRIHTSCYCLGKCGRGIIGMVFSRSNGCSGLFGTKAHNILTALFHFLQNPTTVPSASAAVATHSLG